MADAKDKFTVEMTLDELTSVEAGDADILGQPGMGPAIRKIIKGMEHSAFGEATITIVVKK